MERGVRVRATLLPLLVASCGSWGPEAGGDSASEADVDGDGFLATDDCDDQNSRVSPNAIERCNRQDDDCDGEVDESADACPGDFTTEGGNEMIVVWPGHFIMGAAPAGRSGSYTEHPVTLTRAYWLGEHEVLQSEWEKAGVGNPSAFPGRTQPVETVSWESATAYANWLSAVEGLEPCYAPDGEALAEAFFEDAYACPGYRFPTESEWEYAARAGTDFEGDPISWTVC